MSEQHINEPQMMSKTAERARCKTCNSQYRLEIEKMRLVQGKTYREIKEYLQKKYSFFISEKGLSNHFNICLRQKQRVAEQSAESEEIIREIRERRKDLVQILFDSLAELVADKARLEKYLRSGKIEKTSRTMVDLLRVLASEVREYVKTINQLMSDSGKDAGIKAEEIIAKYEEYRKKNAELLQNLKSYEVRDEETAPDKGGDNDGNSDDE